MLDLLYVREYIFAGVRKSKLEKLQSHKVEPFLEPALNLYFIFVASLKLHIVHDVSFL